MNIQGDWLSPEEREQAYKHWDSLMFAPSEVELENARTAFQTSPHPIQLAVMVAIGQLWARPGEPQREDNPFTPID